MIPIQPFQPQKGMHAGAYRIQSPLYKLMADLWLTDEWRVVRRATAVREVIVTDTSFWQDNNTTTRKIDFVQMKAAGAQGVIIRGGQGSWIDEDFVDSWRAAKAAGLPRGAYWYYDPRHDPLKQAELFAGLFANDLPELGISLDAEYPTSWGGAYAGWTYLRDFMERLKVKLPSVQKEIYTGYYWWYENVWMKTTSAQLAYFKQYPLHLAWYANDPSYVKIPLPWTQADFRWWQYTSSGNGPLYGVESATVDLNNFVPGGVDEFKKTFSLNTTTPPPPPNGGTMNGTAKENGGRTGNIRTTPSRYGTVTGQVTAYATIEFVKVVPSIDNGAYAADQWFQLPDGRYLNYIISGQKYFTILTEPTTEPPPTTEPSIFMTHTFTDDLIVTQPDGTIKAYGATFTIPNVEYKPKP